MRQNCKLLVVKNVGVLNLGQNLYAHPENLSKTLPQKKMSAVKERELADLTVETLQAMMNDRDFSLFYKTVKKSASTIKYILTATVPRNCKRSNYSILQYIEGNASTTWEAHYPETAVDHFKSMYMKAIDAIINSIKNRSEQPGFKVFGQIEHLLLKSEGRIVLWVKLKPCKQISKVIMNQIF